MESSEVSSATAGRQSAWTRNLRRLFFNSRSVGFLLIGILMVVWEVVVVTKTVDLISFPLMSGIIGKFFTLIADGEIVKQVVPSLQRMFIGYFLAIIAGVAVGLLMGYFRFVYHLLEPLTELLRPIPSPAYIPIIILFLGLGDTMKIFAIFLASFFPILLNAYAGVRSVDRVQIDTARTFGLNSRQIVWEIIMPASAPYFFAGMRISLGIALILVVISEMVASNDGIGYFVLDMQRSFRIKEMYAGVVMLALMGYFLNRLLMWFERFMIGWSFAQNRAEERVSKC